MRQEAELETSILSSKTDFGCLIYRTEFFAAQVDLEGRNSIRNSFLEGGIYIGLHSYINSGSKVKHAHIGRYTSIADDVVISPNKHPSRWFSTHPSLITQSTVSDSSAVGDPRVFIGSDVWIGSRAIIMGGIHVADGAIVAAGAVVTKPVEPFSIVAGVPAVTIGYRFNRDQIKRIERLQWWNYNLEALGATDMSKVEGVLDLIESEVAAGRLSQFKRVTTRLTSARRCIIDGTSVCYTKD